jgi:hypothetical protein
MDSLFLQPPFPHGRFVSYPFSKGRMLRCFVYWAFFCIGPFSCIAIFCGVCPSYIFFSLLDDIHIIGPTSIIHLAFDHFVCQFFSMGFLIQPR